MYELYVIKHVDDDVYASATTTDAWTKCIEDAIHFPNKRSAGQFKQCLKGLIDVEVVAIECGIKRS